MANESAKETDLSRVSNMQAKVNDETITAEVFRSFEILAGMQQEWDDFVESVGGDIFLTYDWCRIWWKYYGKDRDLRVFVFRANNEIVGIIPLFFEKVWLGPIFVRAGKIVGSDFTLSQFSIPLDSSHMAAIIEKFAELISRDRWDIIHIGPIAGIYSDFDGLKTVCEEHFGNSYSVLSGGNTVQTYFHLQGNWDDYIASLGKRERRNIRVHYRSLNKAVNDESAQIDSTFVTEDNFDDVFDNFVRTHQSHWNKLGKGGHFGDWPKSREFHRELAKTQMEKGRLRFLRSSIKNRCLGYEYYYKFGERYAGIVTAHSDFPELRNISLGKITFGELVKKILDEEIHCVDSMRGKYEYKLKLGGKIYPIRSLYIIRSGLSIVIRVSVFRVLARFLNTCYYKLWFCRIAPKLHLKPRPLWRAWIRTEAFA